MNVVRCEWYRDSWREERESKRRAELKWPKEKPKNRMEKSARRSCYRSELIALYISSTNTRCENCSRTSCVHHFELDATNSCVFFFSVCCLSRNGECICESTSPLFITYVDDVFLSQAFFSVLLLQWRVCVCLRKRKSMGSVFCVLCWAVSCTFF